MMFRALDAQLVAAVAQDGTRRITALVMPWNQPATVTDNGTDFYRESFARGSLLMRAGVPVTVVNDHDAAAGISGPQVGTVTAVEDTPEGLLAELSIDATDPVAAQVEQSLAAGTPIGVSIEFDSLGIDDPLAGGGVLRRAAILTGVALATTNTAQYPTARVLSMRATSTTQETLTVDTTTDTTTTDTTQEDQTDMTDTATQTTDTAADETQRRARSEAARGGATTEARTEPRFRSFGHFAYESALGHLTDPERARYAQAMSRSRRALATTSTSTAPGLIQDQWLTDVVDFIGTARPFIDSFHTMPLPDKGTSIHFPKVTTRPSTSLQAAELDQPSSTASQIDEATATVQTFSGGETMSMQLLRRSDPSYLELVMELYAEEMAIDQDVAAITAALAAISGGNALAISAATDLNTGLNARLVAGAKQILSGRVGRPEVMVAGLDVWEVFANALDDMGRPLYPEIIGAGGEPGSGTIALDGGNGRIRNLEFVPDANMTATKAIMGWRRAFTTMLSPIETIGADTVAKLGRETAVFQFSAFLSRRPTAAIEYTLGA